MNNITLVGRLTAEPVLKWIEAKGKEAKPICEISIACERAGGRKDGDGRTEVDFFDIKIWFNAEQHARHLVQGQRIHITGTVRQERWTDQNTDTNRSRHVVVAKDTEWLDKPRNARTVAEPTDDETIGFEEEEAF
jgi:single stranded DNA-binding protein